MVKVTGEEPDRAALGNGGDGGALDKAAGAVACLGKPLHVDEVLRSLVRP